MSLASPVRSPDPVVMFLAPAAFPLGGVANWLDYLLPGLQACGWRCVLGLLQGEHHDVESYLRRHPWHDVRCIANPSGSPQGRVQAVADAIDQVRPDLVGVVNAAAAYEAVRRLRLGGKTRCKVFMSLHALQQDFLNDVALEADVLDAVVATNQLAVRLSGDRLGAADRVFYAAYGVPLQNTSDQTPPREPGLLKLLYSGRLDQRQKRILDLPEMMTLVNQRGVSCRLDIAGGGPDESMLRADIAARGLTPCFRFLGELSPQALAHEYAAHDALVITSAWETGPIVAWEAMSHGLPVVSSRYVGSGLEGGLVDKRNCLLFPVGDVQSAADAVQALAATGTREQLVAGGLELVRSRYNENTSLLMWDRVLRQILELPALPLPKRNRPAPVSGRLDSWLGPRLAERLRRVLGRRYRHGGPGDEWPHSNQACASDGPFLERARDLDQNAS